MSYIEILPREGLRPYINCFWAYQGEPDLEVSDCTFPDGSLEIIFNIQTGVSRSFNNSNFTPNASAELVGQMTSPYHVKFSGMNRFLGVRFFPHTFYCFWSGPVNQFNDLSIEASGVLSGGFNGIARIIESEEDTATQIRILEEFFLKKLNYKLIDPKHKLLEYAVRTIYHREVNSINDLTRDLGVQERTLQRLFKERVGISPKFFLKIVRFQKTFKYLKRNCNLTSISYECGYFDQAHFIRDFKFFTGCTPSEYLLKVYPLNKHFLSEETHSYLYGFR